MALVVNSQVYVHAASDRARYPHWIAQEDIVSLVVFEQIAWTQHPINGVWWPWLVDTDFVALRDQLQLGIQTCTPAQLAAAQRLGLVYDVDHVLRARILWTQQLQQCRAQIAQQGWCKIPAITFAHYTRTVDKFVTRVLNTLVTDTQVAGRLGQHNPSLFRAVHTQLAALIQSVANEPIKSTYCYLGHYQTGAELVRHTDRPQCRWNASICFARTDGIWPIWVETHGQAHELHADIGEVIVYQGTTVPHWREPLTQGTQTVCFYHFVDQAFQGELK